MNTPTEYADFIASKRHLDSRDGFSPVFMPDFLFPFQAALVEWAIAGGRRAIFADCGLGKTPMYLTWAENVLRHTGKPVLVVTPLSVSPQVVTEGEKFGIEVKRSGDGTAHTGCVNVTNYERLHLFDPDAFSGVVCDESSILKNFDGALRQSITHFMRKVRYRALATATAAPNDYMELGTSSEALGYLGATDMLNKFFKNEQGKGAAASRAYGKQVHWRLRPYAEESYWRWVCSWARAIRKPSDMGFSDEGFTLPPLVQREFVVGEGYVPDGMFVPLPAITMQEQREEIRRTLTERCERAAALAMDASGASVLWANLNDEADLLERLIPGARQASGAMRDEEKEEVLAAFMCGEVTKLITKPKITGFGMNWQHCAHTVVFPTHSYEQWYQMIRRFWRFGQSRVVTADVVVPDGARGMLNNVQKKAERADAMFARLVELMNDALHVDRSRDYPNPAQVPSWL
jgi:hypothetical protein